MVSPNPWYLSRRFTTQALPLSFANGSILEGMKKMTQGLLGDYNHLLHDITCITGYFYGI